MPHPGTEDELDGLLGGFRAAAQLFVGERGTAVRSAYRDAVARLAWLATEVPEIAEAEINPLIPTAAGLVAVDVRVRLAPVALEDPWLRTLPA